MTTKSLAIPIRCVDYSNSSQIVSFLSAENGLLEGIAKGSYRPKNSFQGPFDLAVLYEVVFLERKAGGLAILTEANVVDGFRYLRRAWAPYVGATHVTEFVRAVATSGEESRSLFALMVRTLRALELAADEDVFPTLRSFDLQALRLIGLLPPVNSCVSCGRVWPDSDRPVFFSAKAGGLVCRACRHQPGRSWSGLEVPGGAVRALQHLAHPHPEPVREEIQQHYDRHRSFVDRTVEQLRNHLLERELTVLKSGRRAIRVRSRS